MQPSRWRWLVLAGLAIAVAACGGTSSEPSSSPAPAAGSLAGIVVKVSQSETCGCCGGWVEYLEDLGATVEVAFVDDVAAAKPDGMPSELGSCHTATVGGYAVEGHVPAAAVIDLLESAPDIDGIALPGMPVGAPGMPGDAEGPFEVIAFKDGVTEPFGVYD